MRESPGSTPLILGFTTVLTVDATGMTVPTEVVALTLASVLAMSEQV